jgi:hypothetical protein
VKRGQKGNSRAVKLWGRQNARFLENNVNYDASLYVGAGIFSFEGSELLVL